MQVDCLLNKIGVATPDIARKFFKNKTVILRNFPILKLIDNTMPVSHRKNKPIIIYTGGFTKVRGIKEIVKAMEYIGNRTNLWLLGKCENEKFKKECENLNGWEYTKYLGFISFEEVYSILKISDMGIFFPHPIEGSKESLPIKLFEYMACLLPILVSNFDYWQKLFKECVLFADPYKPKGIANKILYLLDNSDIANRVGKKGREMVEKQYSWESESKKLLNMYKNI